ncbi:hypothetical protein HHI36_017114 [Cryptolaemus montrouzieri]|uniref:Uncharacterized protein n=1 Tax=Cryptolaemus montrouzieri TaxID=559131 RepID=A0ABD2NLZ2_9CUCU
MDAASKSHSNATKQGAEKRSGRLQFRSYQELISVTHHFSAYYQATPGYPIDSRKYSPRTYVVKAEPDKKAKRTTRPLVEISREERRSLDRRSMVEGVRRSEENLKEENEEQRSESRQIEDALTSNLLRYTSLSLDLRPPTPILRYSQNVLKSVEEANVVPAKKIEHTTSLAAATDLVYTGAVAICEVSGVQIKTQKSLLYAKSEPVWSTHLIVRIVNIRKKVGVLHTFINTAEPNMRLLESVREIVSQFSPQTQESELQTKNHLCAR